MTERMNDLLGYLERIAMALEETVEKLDDITAAMVVSPSVEAEPQRTLVPLDPTPVKAAWVERAVNLYGENALIAMEKDDRAKDFLRWAVTNRINPEQVIVGPDGVLAIDMDIKQRYDHS